MKRNNARDNRADTYYFRVSRIILFLSAIMAVAVLKIVSVAGIDPDFAIRFDPLVPEMMKNILLICAFVLGGGLVFEIFSNREG